LLATLDWVSATVALAGVLTIAFAWGLSPRWLVRRAWWLLPVALLAAVPMALYGGSGGRVYLHWGLIEVSEQSVHYALALFARVFALAVPSLILFAGVDATRVADALTQVARLPARPVYATVAGMRLMGLLSSDWRSLSQARRARGLGDQRRFRRAATMAFALLVFALRRGTRLAVAMEARGLSAGARTAARRSVLTWRDPVAVGAAALLMTAALGLAVLLGTFHAVVLG
jgi:energy-coupling factor transport system permease protein